jgi:hypothetical protein
LFGVGIDANIVAASLKAVASALTRARISDQVSVPIAPSAPGEKAATAVCP